MATADTEIAGPGGRRAVQFVKEITRIRIDTQAPFRYLLDCVTEFSNVAKNRCIQLAAQCHLPERPEVRCMATKGKILIVDDDPDFTKSTKMFLLADGYQVVTASDGKQGLEKIREVAPDVIILDIMMESLFEGFSLVASLRTDPAFAQYRTTPILMASSVRTDTGSRFDFDAHEDMGNLPEPDDYLDKPFKPKELLERIAELMARKQS